MANIINPQSDSERLAKVEGILEQMDKRLTSLENRMTSLENRMTSLENRMSSNFKWLVGLLITVLIANVGTAITIILTLSKSP